MLQERGAFDPLLYFPFVQARAVDLYVASLPSPWLRELAQLDDFHLNFGLEVSMPAYCFQDCHYFYRSALRLLSLPTIIGALYA